MKRWGRKPALWLSGPASHMEDAARTKSLKQTHGLWRDKEAAWVQERQAVSPLVPDPWQKDSAGLLVTPRCTGSLTPSAVVMVFPTSRQLPQLSVTQAPPGITHKGTPGRAEPCLGSGTLT